MLNETHLHAFPFNRKLVRTAKKMENRNMKMSWKERLKMEKDLKIRESPMSSQNTLKMEVKESPMSSQNTLKMELEIEKENLLKENLKLIEEIEENLKYFNRLVSLSENISENKNLNLEDKNSLREDIIKRIRQGQEESKEKIKQSEELQRNISQLDMEIIQRKELELKIARRKKIELQKEVTMEKEKKIELQKKLTMEKEKKIELHKELTMEKKKKIELLEEKIKCLREMKETKQFEIFQLMKINYAEENEEIVVEEKLQEMETEVGKEVRVVTWTIEIASQRGLEEVQIETVHPLIREDKLEEKLVMVQVKCKVPAQMVQAHIQEKMVQTNISTEMVQVNIPE